MHVKEKIVTCSDQSALLLALAYHIAPQSLVAIAHRLANNHEYAAIKFSKALNAMPIGEAKELTEHVLTRAGFALPTNQVLKPTWYYTAERAGAISKRIG